MKRRKMRSKFKPMLAATLEKGMVVLFPVLVSPKLDGIRCIICDGIPLSRSLKPIPNKFVGEALKDLHSGLDGELMVDGKDFNGVQSDIMTEDGEPNFKFHVFDYLGNPKLGFEDRHRMAKFLTEESGNGRIEIVPHYEVSDLENLIKWHQEFIRQGYEGTMIRSVGGPYKYGRSTPKEGYLFKLKDFKTAEATVVGFTEHLHNTNEPTVNELGYTERSLAKAGMVPTGMLGALKVVLDVSDNLSEFEIGTGFTEAQRIDIWNRREELKGALVTYKYQQISAKGKPRFPVFIGFRHTIDME